MTGTSAVVLAALVVLAIVWLNRGPLKLGVSGLLTRDRKTGQIRLALTPARKRKRRKRG